MRDYAHMSDEWIQCRTLIHAWEEIPDDGVARRDFPATRSVVRLCFRCLRCGTKRYEAWSAVTGDLLMRVYRTPAGYSLPKGKGRRVLMRREYLERKSRPVRKRNAA